MLRNEIQPFNQKAVVLVFFGRNARVRFVSVKVVKYMKVKVKYMRVKAVKYTRVKDIQVRVKRGLYE